MVIEGKAYAGGRCAHLQYERYEDLSDILPCVSSEMGLGIY